MNKTDDKERKVSALDVARFFHESYERLAPEYGYETKPETREFRSGSANGRLMQAVCAEVIERFFPPSARGDIADEAIIFAFSNGGSADEMPTHQPHAPLLTNAQIVWVVRRFLAGEGLRR